MLSNYEYEIIDRTSSICFEISLLIGIKDYKTFELTCADIIETAPEWWFPFAHFDLLAMKIVG